MLEACPTLDALITWIPADEELLCGNAAVYAVIIIIIIKHTAQLDFEQELPLIHSMYGAGTPVLEL